MKRTIYIFAEVATPIIVVLLILWFTNASGIFFFPPLQEVFVAFQQNWLSSRVVADLLPSIYRLVLGYVLAVLIAIVGGLLIGRIGWLRRQASPIIEFLRAIPPSALLPFTLVALGVNDPAKIALIAFVCIWPILLNTVDGVVGIDLTLRETGESYRITGIDRVFVELRAASPQIVAGMQASLPLALIMMVVSEMIGANNGIGYFIIQAQRTFALADMWSGIILLGVLGYILNALFQMCERRVLSWHIGARASAN